MRSLQRQPDVTEAARCPKTAQDCHPNTAAQGHWRGHATATPRSLIARTRKLYNIPFPPGPPDNDSSETGQPRWRLHTPCPASVGGAGPGSGVAVATVDTHRWGPCVVLYFLEALGSHVFRAKEDS